MSTTQTATDGLLTQPRQGPVLSLAPVPDRSLTQRRDALGKANRIRLYRAEVKAHVKAGECDAIPLIFSPPRELGTMKVRDLMLAMPKWGTVKVNKALVRCRVSPSKTLGGMSERQRHELVSAIRARQSQTEQARTVKLAQSRARETGHPQHVSQHVSHVTRAA